MKAFYEQYGNGATLDLSLRRHVGRLAEGGMMGGSWDREPHVGHAATAPSWMTEPPAAASASGSRCAHGRPPRCTAWQQRYAGNLTGSAAQTALQTHDACTCARRSRTSTATTT